MPVGKGARPRMTKVFTGRGKTRPIPRVVDSSDRLAARKVQIEQTPRTSPVKALNPRYAPSGGVLGSRVRADRRAGTYSPQGTSDNI